MKSKFFLFYVVLFLLLLVAPANASLVQNTTQTNNETPAFDAYDPLIAYQCDAPWRIEASEASVPVLAIIDRSG